MKKGIKHLIECHCTLSIYKKNRHTIYHKFPVYSKIDGADTIISKVVQCNNCGVIHKVVDLCKSEILGGKDDFKISLVQEDIEMQLPSKITNILIKNNCDFSTWEHVLDVIDEERWGELIVLSRQIIDEKQHIKTLAILSESKVKIENKVIEDEIVMKENSNEVR